MPKIRQKLTAEEKEGNWVNIRHQTESSRVSRNENFMARLPLLWLRMRTECSWKRHVWGCFRRKTSGSSRKLGIKDLEVVLSYREKALGKCERAEWTELGGFKSLLDKNNIAEYIVGCRPGKAAANTWVCPTLSSSQGAGTPSRFNSPLFSDSKLWLACQTWQPGRLYFKDRPSAT